MLQSNTNGLIPSSRFFWKRRGVSLWHVEEPACSTNQVPLLACASSHHRDHPLPCKWWNMVKDRIANIIDYCILSQQSFGGLFVFNLIFKSWKRISATKNETKTKSKTTTKNLPRRHETYLSKNNDVVLQKVNKEENQWHYIIETQDKYRVWIPLNMNTVQRRGGKADI